MRERLHPMRERHLAVAFTLSLKFLKQGWFESVIGAVDEVPSRINSRCTVSCIIADLYNYYSLPKNSQPG